MKPSALLHVSKSNHFNGRSISFFLFCYTKSTRGFGKVFVLQIGIYFITLPIDYANNVYLNQRTKWKVSCWWCAWASFNIHNSRLRWIALKNLPLSITLFLKMHQVGGQNVCYVYKIHLEIMIFRHSYCFPGLQEHQQQLDIIWRIVFHWVSFL